MFNRNHRMWRNALMLGGLLVVAVVAVALFDVLRTFVHGFGLSFLRDVGAGVPPAGDGGAPGAAAAAGAWQEQLKADQDQYLKDHPPESPSDSPPSEVEQAKAAWWKKFWTQGSVPR